MRQKLNRKKSRILIWSWFEEIAPADVVELRMQRIPITDVVSIEGPNVLNLGLI